jgi:hypothetical protein
MPSGVKSHPPASRWNGRGPLSPGPPHKASRDPRCDARLPLRLHRQSRQRPEGYSARGGTLAASVPPVQFLGRSTRLLLRAPSVGPWREAVAGMRSSRPRAGARLARSSGLRDSTCCGRTGGTAALVEVLSVGAPNGGIADTAWPCRPIHNIARREQERESFPLDVPLTPTVVRVWLVTTTRPRSAVWLVPTVAVGRRAWAGQGQSRPCCCAARVSVSARRCRDPSHWSMPSGPTSRTGRRRCRQG